MFENDPVYNNGCDIRLCDKIRKRAEKRLRRLIKPHVWQSGYGDIKLFAFPPKGKNQNRIRTIPGCLHDQLRYLELISPEGVVDANGVGARVWPWSDLPLDEILLLEKWLNRHLSEEVAHHHERMSKRK